MKNKPELLLPVGNFEMCEAAVHNGADAIYVGVPHFNARGRTKDFSFAELKQMIDYCHLYGVKVNVAFNVLIFEAELPLVVDHIKQLAQIGPDAVIVQDLGLAQLIREICPNLPIHASTQMTVTNADAIEFLSELNIKRFVLGRENSLPEIKAIKEKTDKELEVFVHGALCVAYSGQCFTSESIGGRSANRGQCAQSCRFSYDMYVDGKHKDLVDREYLVSPKDLCGINEVQELTEAGVSCFKIEGRLKSAAYVASTAHSYRQAIDHNDKKANQAAMEEMATTYSRGFFSGWLHGVDHQQLVDGSYSAHRGLAIAEVKKITDQYIVIETDQELENGQGLLIVSTNGEELGSTIWSCQKKTTQKNAKPEWTIGLDNKFPLKNIAIGAKVYLNSAPKLFKNLSQSYTDKQKLKKLPLKLKLEAKIGQIPSLKGQCGNISIQVDAPELLSAAQNPQDLSKIQAELNAFGATPYQVTELQIDLGIPEAFIANKTIKTLRRQLTEELNRQRTQYASYNYNDYQLKQTSSLPEALSETKSKLNVLLRDHQQVQEVQRYLSQNPVKLEYLGHIILDFEFGKDYQISLDTLKNIDVKVGIATNRILKPNEYHHLNHILRLNPDFILVRNLGAFHYIKSKAPHMECKGDFSLNVSNSITADFLLKKGLSSLVPSYDLNREQLVGLVKNSPHKNFEVTIHQYMPSFHMEHCVFAAFLSTGSSFRDCGKPCEKHQVELKDQFGNRHFIKADQECRNTMYNAIPQTASNLVGDCMPLGVHEYRYEALFEQKAELIEKIQTYLSLIANELSPEQVQAKLKTVEKYGIGSGQLFKSDNYAARKKQEV